MPSASFHLKQSRKRPLSRCLTACEPLQSPSHVSRITQVYARRLPTRESCNTHSITEAITALLSANVFLKEQRILLPFFLPNSSFYYCTHFTTPMLSPIISPKQELNCFLTSYLQSHLNGVSLKPIHQPEKS